MCLLSLMLDGTKAIYDELNLEELELIYINTARLYFSKDNVEDAGLFSIKAYMVNYSIYSLYKLCEYLEFQTGRTYTAPNLRRKPI